MDSRLQRIIDKYKTKNLTPPCFIDGRTKREFTYTPAQIGFNFGSSESWLRKGQEIKAVVKVLENILLDILEEPPDFGSISSSELNKWLLRDNSTKNCYMLLAGYVLENYSKGIIIANNPSLIDDKKQLDKFKKGHKLRQLIVKAGVDFESDFLFGADSEYVKHLCERLENFIIWAGKYPSPLPEKRDAIVWGCFEPDLVYIDHLIERLERTLASLVRQADSPARLQP